MVKKLLSLSIIAGAGVVGACFGDGPMPSAPSRATVLFTGQPLINCNGTYIGPVAVGVGSGYVTMLPYVASGGPAGGSCGGGQQIPSQAQSVFTFNKDSGSLTKLGSAGESGQSGHDYLTTTATGVAYAYAEPTSMITRTYVDPGHIAVGGGMGVDMPFGIAQAGSDLYVGVTGSPVTTGQPETDNPEYPCCGGGPQNNPPTGALWKVGGGSIAQVNPVCSTLDRCVVGNSSSVIYFEHPNTAGNELWQLTALATSSLTPTMIASLSSGPEVPVGLDADDTTIAYTTSLTCTLQNQSSQCTVDECNVFAYDIASAMPKTLLSTQQWGCMDAKLAGGYVYFTIVGFDSHTEHVFGRGIGRVSIADRTFESLDLGIRGDAGGPRRIYPSGDQLYVVDPLVMARIAAADLDGKHDFTP